MRSSLQEQLLQSGLVSEDQLDKARQKRNHKNASRKGGKPKGKGGKGTGSKHASHSKKGKRSADEMNLAKAYSLRAQTEAEEKRAALEEQERRTKANKKLKELIDKKALDNAQGESERYFQFNKRIRKLFVRDEHMSKLDNGEACIVHFKGRFYVLNADDGQAAETLKPDAIVMWNRDGEVQDVSPESTTES